MPRTLLALVALLLPVPALAQFGVSSISDPLRPVRTPLAHAAEVPDVLLLGLGGPTATLVNPARAARLRGRFVYGTIQPRSGGPEPVSLVGLAGSRDRRWLVVAENSTYVDDFDESFIDRRTDAFPENGTRIYESERIRSASRTNAVTRARLLLAGRTDFGGYAFGLFGGYRSADEDVVQSLTSFSNETRLSPPTADVRRQDADQSRHQHRDDFGVGVEVALAGRTWDLATSLSYQRRSSDAGFEDAERTVRDFEDPNTTLMLDDRTSTAFSADASPEAVDFEVLGALRMGERRDDYLFGAVTGTFGGGTAGYRGMSSSQRTLVQTLDGEVVNEESFSSTFDDAGEVDLDTRATRVSLGYVYARRHRGVTVLAALNPTAASERVDQADTGPAFASKREIEQLHVALNLPLYVRFDVTRRLEVFGGGVYSYAYRRTEVDERPLYPVDLLDGDPTIETVRDQTSETLASDSRFYAGALLTFRSGFAAQASFNGDLAAIDRWTVSLGYRF